VNWRDTVKRLMARFRFRQRRRPQPPVRLYLPDNGRGDGPPVGEHPTADGRASIIIYDPENPPPELTEGPKEAS